jgi:hypothetical protein
LQNVIPKVYLRTFYTDANVWQILLFTPFEVMQSTRSCMTEGLPKLCTQVLKGLSRMKKHAPVSLALERLKGKPCEPDRFADTVVFAASVVSAAA